jgi:hypothetical protein
MAEQIIRYGKLRAATWKLWTDPKKVGVYLACRELHGELKASLHESGKWHVSYTQKFFERRVAGSGGQAQKSRFVQEWARPRPLSARLTLAYRILTPHSSVTSPMSAKDAKVIWLPNCPPGKATEIDIFLISNSTAVTGWPGKNKMATKLVGRYDLPDGGSVWVVYWVTDMPELSGTKEGRGRFYVGKTKRDLNADNLRVMAFSHHESDGSRVMYDLAVKREFVQVSRDNQSPDLADKVMFFRLAR